MTTQETEKPEARNEGLPADAMDPERPVVSETMLLAAIPAIGYLAAYAHDRNYCMSFGIPPALISVDLTHVLSMSLIEVMVATGVVAPVLFLLIAVHRVRTTWIRRTVPIIIALLVVLPAIALVGDYWPLLLPLIAVGLAPLIGDLLLEKVIYRALDEGGPKTRAEFQRFMGASVAAATALVMITGAGVWGFTEARTERVFGVIEDQAAVAIYGDRAIMLPLRTGPCPHDGEVPVAHFQLMNLASRAVSVEMRDLGDQKPCTR